MGRIETRACRSCGNDKSIEDFYASRKWRCKECVRATVHKYCIDNADKISAKRKIARGTSEGKRKERSRGLKRHYGMTLEELEAAIRAQIGLCAVDACGTEISAFDKHTHVDHDHTTNVRRGILCVNCNFAVGHAFDDPARLRSIADYLEAYL